MSSASVPRSVVVHPDVDTLVQATAARLLLRLLDLQSVRRPVHVVLTGGSVGIATLAAVAASPLRDAVDWTGVHLWWGDERFLPSEDPERNEKQARDALLDGLVDAGSLPATHIHAMPAADHVASAEDGARTYAGELAIEARGADGADAALAVPRFDVVLLGMGPDGHLASLFPGQSTLDVTDASVVAVHNSPKPPPDRISLTFTALAHADEVWFIVAGTSKSEALEKALAGDLTIPAARAHGRRHTLWLVDLAATAR